MQVVITTGGTGITSRDTTFEAIDALLEKRLDGFGELFRMLSFQEIGSAAMLSRACAGLAKSKVDHLAARVGERRAAGDDEARAAGTRPPGAGSVAVGRSRSADSRIPRLP